MSGHVPEAMKATTPTRRWQHKRFLIEHCLRNRGPGVREIDHALVGNDLWMVCRVYEESSTDTERVGFQFIVLVELDRDLDGWFATETHESEGPRRYTCPERLVKLSHDTSEAAVRWRQRCREHRAQTRDRLKFIAGLQPGDPFVCSGQTFRFVERFPNYGKDIIGMTTAGSRVRCRKVDIRRPG